MSSTLAALLYELDPKLKFLIVERLSGPALESSSADNNAGTGHAANCELNYTPLDSKGKVQISKALEINAAFEKSLEFFAELTSQGKLQPKRFLHLVPHMSVVWGEADVEFLRKRFEKLSYQEAFSSMKFSTDLEELKEWMPLVMEGRSRFTKMAATRFERGTDIDFGELTRSYLDYLKVRGAVDLCFETDVVDLRRCGKSLWQVDLQGPDVQSSVETPFVFLGAGGGSLPLLQKSGIPQSRLYAGFPVSGQWLVCSNSELTQRHNAKIYGKAKVGAPPMSVPHLDSRWIQGKRSLLFGPFAGFTSKFLKRGSLMDLPRSVNFFNLLPMLEVGAKNVDLINYLVSQLLQSQSDRFEELKQFFPKARGGDWKLSIAGQRVQIIKCTPEGGRLQMGTEVVSASDGSLAALMGASPGASTAVSIMLEILDKCWREQMASDSWQKRLREIFPSYEMDLLTKPQPVVDVRERIDQLLELN